MDFCSYSSSYHSITRIRIIKMQKISKISTIAYIALAAFQSFANTNNLDTERVWEVKNVDDRFIWYRVPGQTIWGHRYGFIKDSKDCESDMFFIEWSSYEDIKKHEGKVVAMTLKNDKGNQANIKPLLYYVDDFTRIMQVGFFGEDQSHYTSTSAFDLFNKESETVTVSIDDGFDNFDIKSDTFITKGFLEARKNAALSCRKLASNLTLLIT